MTQQLNDENNLYTGDSGPVVLKEPIRTAGIVESESSPQRAQAEQRIFLRELAQSVDIAEVKSVIGLYSDKHPKRPYFGFDDPAGSPSLTTIYEAVERIETILHEIQQEKRQTPFSLRLVPVLLGFGETPNGLSKEDISNILLRLPTDLSDALNTVVQRQLLTKSNKIGSMPPAGRPVTMISTSINS